MEQLPLEQLELLTAYLDGELTPTEAINFESLLENSAQLQRELALAKASKVVVRSRATQLRETIPVDLERTLRMAIANEASQEATSESKPSFIETLLGIIARPAFAITALLAVAVGVTTIVVVNNATPTSSVAMAPYNLYEASYANFSSIVKGDLQVKVASSDPKILDKFFKDEGVEYTVFYPEVAATLVGGVVSEHNGKKYAHLVYGAGDHLVYIFEVDRESINNNIVALEKTVKKDLETSKWHWEDRANVGTMFVWESNNVVCSAVSDLRTQDLSALFTLETL